MQAKPNPGWNEGFKTTLLVGALIFAASMLGVLSRPMGQLAALWPANAVLLGLMLRFPALATRWGWLGALLGYLLADVGRHSLLISSLLTAGNFAAVITGYVLFMRLDPEHRRLRLPLSVPYLVVITAAASAAGGLVGAIVDPMLFGGTAVSGGTFWFVSELVNFMAMLPLMLTLPDRARLLGQRRQRSCAALRVRQTIGKLLPFLSFILCCVLGDFIGGPGALAFPVPALLWCALRYSFFTTCVITLLFTGWTLIAVSIGVLTITVDDMNSRPMQFSLRLGVALLALAPITVASVMAARDEIFRRLQHMAHHDQLSGLLNRRAFRDRAGVLLQKLTTEQRPVAVLMMDIDKFKSINDCFGHAAGDQVLSAFARVAGESLRKQDPFGRIGGEEFGVLLADCPHERALGIAQALCDSFAATPTVLDDGRQIAATVSIGLAHASVSCSGLDPLALAADQALYRAKALGRNRVESQAVEAAAGAPAASVAPA